MTTNRHEPADIRSMGIVHGAARDLERTRMVLTEQPYPDPRQRRARASHLSWMMHFLHMHHTGEDVGLWPLMRARNPSARALLDQMDADHRRIGPRSQRSRTPRAPTVTMTRPRAALRCRGRAGRRPASAPAARGAGDDTRGCGHPHRRAVPGRRARALRGTQRSARARGGGTLGARRAPTRRSRGHAVRGPARAPFVLLHGFATEAIAGPQSDGGATARPRTCRHCRCRR